MGIRFFLAFFLLLRPGYLVAQSLVLPHIAVGGPEAGLHALTTITFVNDTFELIEGSGELLDDQGAPLSVRVDGSEPTSSFEWSVGPGRVLALVLSSSQQVPVAGCLRVTPARATVSAVVQIFEGEVLVSQAGLFSTPPLSVATIIHDSRGPNGDTGIAVCNPTSSTNELRFTLISRTGETLTAGPLPPVSLIGEDGWRRPHAVEMITQPKDGK